MSVTGTRYIAKERTVREEIGEGDGNERRDWEKRSLVFTLSERASHPDPPFLLHSHSWYSNMLYSKRRHFFLRKLFWSIFSRKVSRFITEAVVSKKDKVRSKEEIYTNPGKIKWWQGPVVSSEKWSGWKYILNKIFWQKWEKQVKIFGLKNRTLALTRNWSNETKICRKLLVIRIKPHPWPGLLTGLWNTLCFFLM